MGGGISLRCLWVCLGRETKEGEWRVFERRRRRRRRGREDGVEEEMKGSGGEGGINTRSEGRGWSLIVRAERRLEQRGEAG